MTKNELANQINHTINIVRTISVNWELDIIEGQLYDNQGKAESWSDDSCTKSFENECSNQIKYVFYCSNVPCHKVDYTNKKECEILNADNCESEGEVLVPAETKMVITYVSSEEDYKEMGYYVVELELL